MQKISTRFPGWFRSGPWVAGFSAARGGHVEVAWEDSSAARWDFEEDSGEDNAY